MAKSAGAEVRAAIDGPKIEHDDLISNIATWNREDRGRASSAGETRSAIGAFIERTDINAKALSMLRTIKKAAAKDGGQAKAMDIIRSLQKGLPMIEADVRGQQSEMFDDAPEPDEGGSEDDAGQEPANPLPDFLRPVA